MSVYLLQQVRNALKFAEAGALGCPPQLTGSNSAHMDWLRLDIASARAASALQDLNVIVDNVGIACAASKAAAEGSVVAHNDGQ